MEYTLTKSGITVTIQISIDEHSFSFVRAGVTYKYIVKTFTVDFEAQTINVVYLERLFDGDGGLITKSRSTYTEERPEKYIALYNATAFGEVSGDYYGKQCINGVMDIVVGFKAFEQTGALVS